VIDEVALRGQVLAVLDFDRVAVADSDERLLDGGDGLPAPLDLHPVADAELLLLDRVHLLARDSLEDERLAQAKRLPVHLEHPLAACVLDPEVVADREHLLPHPVLRSSRVTASTEKAHGSSFVSSDGHADG
jgi:hypothetical protein